MATEIKIAPDLDEIKRKGNVFECDFNGMHIKWCIGDDCSDMDEKTEQELYSRLFDQYPDRTVLFITHRTLVSEFCDDIIDIRKH